MTNTNLSNHAETAEGFINYVIKAFREKQWGKILSLIGVVFALLLNPRALDSGLQLLGFSKPSWYSYTVWVVIIALSFIGAFVAKVLTPKRQEVEATKTAISIIKFLLPYTKEDAEWFAKLRRGNNLHECMNFCLAADSSFCILSGESGAGKTSFLQAALLPHLENQGLRPVYVKLIDNPPLTTIKKSLQAHIEQDSPNDNQNLLELLRQATRNDVRPLILIIDQFEQFFAHHKSKTSRHPFIQQMAEWHAQSNSLPVKLLISIRDDFGSRMNEFQNEMKYTLTLHTNLSIEKFDPLEAADVIGVIAKEVGIKLDEGFVKKFTEQELADREDGTISPVDIQILCWMIVRQKRIEERAFDQKAFQKLGGVEGLLKRFLDSALRALSSDPRPQQAAIKVMLALTNGNVRAGSLSHKDLKEKLKETLSDREIEAAISWLVRSDVRLVTQIHEKNVTLYELAHERVIPPLRRLAFKEIKGVEKAHETLDRRVNEWLGNNRSRRYLLTFKEWWLITRQGTLLTSSSQKTHKEEFVSLSKRQFLIVGLGSTAAVALGGGGYAGYRWYEQKLDVQIRRAQERLLGLLANKNDVQAIQWASILLIALGNEKQEKELSERLWEAVSKLETGEQAEVLQILAEAYGRLENTPKTLDALTQIRQKMEMLDTDDQAHVLRSLAGSYNRFGNIRELLDGLAKVRLHTTSLEINLRTHILAIVAQAYGKMGNSGEVMEGLAEVHKEAENLDTYYRAIVLVPLAEAYSKVKNTPDILDDLTEVKRSISGLDTNTKISTLQNLADAYSRVGNSTEALEGLAEVCRETEKLDAYYRCFVLVTLAESYGKVGTPSVVLDALTKVWPEVKLLDPARQASVLGVLADAHSKVGNTSEVLEGLTKIRIETEKLDVSSQVATFQSITWAYSRLGNTHQVVDGLADVHQTAKKLDPQNQAQLLSYVADAYSAMEPNRAVLDGLISVHETTEKLNPNIQIYVLHFLAQAYGKSGDINEELMIIERILKMEKEMLPHIKTLVFIGAASRYAKLGKWKESLRVIEVIDGGPAVVALSRVLLIWRDAKNQTKYMNVIEEVFRNASSSEP